MKEFRYFAAVIAAGVVAVTVSAYQTEKLDLASTNDGVDQPAAVFEGFTPASVQDDVTETEYEPDMTLKGTGHGDGANRV